MSQRAITRVEKPWGYELIWAQNTTYVGKLLFIRAGQKLSLQYHRKKVETIRLHSGQMELLLEDENKKLESFAVAPGEVFHIEALRKHRMIAMSDCEVYEVSTPELDDVVRLEDGYGRT